MWEEQFFSNPWPYLIIDNFFDEQSFSYVNDKVLARKKEYFQDKKRHMKVRDSGTYFHNVPDTFLHNYFSSNLTEDYLKSWFSTHRGYTNLHGEFDIKFSYKPHSWPIHDEVPEKVFSTVVYVAPQNNVGTIIFDKNKNFHGAVSWVPNRAVVFAGLSDITWHCFGNWEKGNRITFDYFHCRQECDYHLPNVSSTMYNT